MEKKKKIEEEKLCKVKLREEKKNKRLEAAAQKKIARRKVEKEEGKEVTK